MYIEVYNIHQVFRMQIDNRHIYLCKILYLTTHAKLLEDDLNLIPIKYTLEEGP